MGKIAEHKLNGQNLVGQDLLLRISELTSSARELREILDTVSQFIADALNIDVCSICLLKPEKKVICIEARKGVSRDELAVFCIKYDRGVIDDMFHNSKPVVLGKISDAPEISSFLNPETHGYHSLLAVPIIQDTVITGMLMLQSQEHERFGQKEVDMMTIIANNLSAAIRSADLYRSVKTQLDELKVIHDISKAITSILNIDELLPYICEEVSKVFHVTGCILRLCEGPNLAVKASYGLPDVIKKEMNLPIGSGIAGHVVTTGEPLIVDDSSKMPDNLRVPGLETTSVMCVPLKIGGKIIGTLGLYDKKDEWGITTFTQDDLNSFMTFASASSVAIENARLYQAELEKEKEVTQTKDYLKSLIDNSADAIITSDLEGIIISWNKGAEKIFGFSSEEVIGQFLPMIPPFLIEEEKNYIKRISQNETLRNLETIRQTKNGTLIEVSLTLSPVLDHAGHITGISGISRDISEKKMVEKELIRKNQELSRLFFVNSVVRSTLELDRLLKMVLTVVTMGDGLGFNRAILFLVDKGKNILQGTMGVGPASPEEAKDIWLSMEDKSLNALIEEIEKGPLHLDTHLDKLSHGLSISLDDPCILVRCIKEKRPFNVRDARAEPQIGTDILKILGAEAFGITPLISRDKVIGLIWVDNLFTGKPIKDEDLEFLVGFSSHISSAIENARLFENVSLARSELRNIFESITDMVYFTDSDYTIKRINQAVVRKTGLPEAEILGKKCYEIFHGKDEPLKACPHFTSFETREPCVRELEEPRLGGTFVVSNSPILDSAGNFVGTVHISRDITELHTLREKVVHSERMAALGELAARVAHEIRNPLISIGGFARRLEKKLDDDTKEYAKIIVNEVTRLEVILKEILGFVKSSRVSKTSTDINKLLTGIVDFISAEVAQSGNTIKKEFSEAPIITLIDPDRIKEAILNIITNAAHATEKGEIKILTRQEGNEAIIELIDTGCGIERENLKNIFNPFFTTKSEGTGLGLAVTHKIIQEHNGKIRVESNVGCGTAFIISLPLER